MMRKILTILILCILSFHLKAQTNDNLIKGYVQLEVGDYEQALNFFSLQLKEVQTPKAFLYRGICNYYLSHTEQAKEDLFKAYTTFEITEAQLWLSKVYAQNGEAQQAINFLSEYISEQPYIQTKKVLKDTAFKVIQTTNYWQEFILDRAISESEKIANEVDYLLTKQRYREGIEYTSDLLLNKSESQLHYYRALFYKENGNLPLAYTDIKFASNEEFENLEFLKEFLFIAAAYNKNEQALALSVELIRLEVENPRWIKEKAKSELKLSRFQDAMNSIQTYLQFHPNDIDALYLKADIYIAKKEFNNAIRTLNIIDANFTPTAKLFLLRGNCYLETGTYKSAAYDFSMYLDLDPVNKEANLNLGKIQYELGNISSACFYWERALQYGSLEATEYIYKYCE